MGNIHSRNGNGISSNTADTLIVLYEEGLDMDKNIVDAFCMMNNYNTYAIMKDYNHVLERFWNFVFLKDFAFKDKDMLENWDKFDSEDKYDVVRVLHHHGQPAYEDYMAAFQRFKVDYSSIYDKLVDPRTLIDEASVKILMDFGENEDD